MFSTPSLITGAATFGLILLCVFIHYEGLNAFSRWIGHGTVSPRPRIAIIIIGQLLLHVIEIALFAVGYYVLASTLDGGILIWIGVTDPQNIPLLDDFADYFYYSAVTYTTLGFGDFVPVGALRFMSGLQAVAGLVLIAWSASFTFLEMQRYWDKD
jgi:hypothetical protein